MLLSYCPVKYSKSNHQPYREPERQDQEVHQEQAVVPDG